MISSVSPSYAQDGEIPSWIKETVKAWGDGIISDSEFVNAIEFLVDAGIINISEKIMEDNFIDIKNEFQITKLDNWELEISRDYFTGRPEYNIIESSTAELAIPTGIRITIDAATDVTLERYYKSQIEKFRDHPVIGDIVATIEYSDSGKGTVDERPSIWFEHSMSIPDVFGIPTEILVKDTIVEYDGNIYSIAYFGLPHNYEEFFDEYAKMFSTFRFNEPDLSSMS